MPVALSWQLVSQPAALFVRVLSWAVPPFICQVHRWYLTWFVEQACQLQQPGCSRQCVRAAVFDGHGDSAAATWLHDNLQDFMLAAVNQSANPTVAAQAAFEAADAELLQFLESASPEGKLLTGAGATASVMLADLEKIVLANVGDSSAVLVRDGKAIHLTTPHRVHGKCVSALQYPVASLRSTAQLQKSRASAVQEQVRSR